MWQKLRNWFWGEEPHGRQGEMDFIPFDKAVICVRPSKTAPVAPAVGVQQPKLHNMRRAKFVSDTRPHVHTVRCLRNFA